MTLTRSSIFINNVRFYAFHGVAEQERRVGAWFAVSVDVGFDIGVAMETDDVADTISYADVLQVVKREMEQPSRLLEHVAGRMAKAIAAEFAGVETVRVSVVKQNPPMGADCDGAGVQVELRS